MRRAGHLRELRIFLLFHHNLDSLVQNAIPVIQNAGDFSLHLIEPTGNSISDGFSLRNLTDNITNVDLVEL